MCRLISLVVGFQKRRSISILVTVANANVRFGKL